MSDDIVKQLRRAAGKGYTTLVEYHTEVQPLIISAVDEIERLRASTRCPAAIRPIEVDGPGPLIQCLYGNGHDGAHQARRGDSDSLYVAWGHNEGDDVVDLVAENERLDGDADEWHERAEAAEEQVADLTTEVIRLRTEMSTMHRSVVHECCVEKQEAEDHRRRLLAAIDADAQLLFPTFHTKQAAAEVRTEMAAWENQ